MKISHLRYNCFLGRSEGIDESSFATPRCKSFIGEILESIHTILNPHLPISRCTEEFSCLNDGQCEGNSGSHKTRRVRHLDDPGLHERHWTSGFSPSRTVAVERVDARVEIIFTNEKDKKEEERRKKAKEKSAKSTRYREQEAEEEKGVKKKRGTPSQRSSKEWGDQRNLSAKCLSTPKKHFRA